MVYEWSEGAQNKDADASLVKREILSATREIQDAVDTAERAVIYAKNNPNSVLYGMLEWDDSIAGHRYRVLQVGRIMRDIVVKKENSASSVPARGHFVTAPADEAPVDKNQAQTAFQKAFFDDINRMSKKIAILKSTARHNPAIRNALINLRYDITQAIGAGG